MVQYFDPLGKSRYINKKTIKTFNLINLISKYHFNNNNDHDEGLKYEL